MTPLRKRMLFLSMLWCAALVGCSDEVGEPNDPAAAESDASESDASGSDASGSDAGGSDAGGSDAGATGASRDPVRCEPSKLRNQVMSHGEKVMEGLSLETSTPIADLLTDVAAYEGKTVQVEGFVTAFCQKRGCWSAIQDLDGDSVLMKVPGDIVDLREIAVVGAYGIGEGTFHHQGSYGVTVKLTGAMFGKSKCDPFEK